MSEKPIEHAANQLIDELSALTKDGFEKNRRLLSFAQFTAMVLEHPARHARNSAQYLRDCFDYFGSVEKETASGRVKHFRLFDLPFDEGQGKLIGQEAVQAAVYRILTSFVHDGRIRRLVLLHGPNGSAKSSFIGCLMRALEVYSQTEAGALYRFNWVFPADKIARDSIGFGGRHPSTSPEGVSTFAFLQDLDVDAKIVCELKDNPLFLIPRVSREGMLNVAGGDEASFRPSDYIVNGDLSHKSKKIYEALLTAYQGDYAGVMRHVQVERFYISRRYRVGAVTVEPQLRVDAGARQVTADRSLQSLPTSLQNQTLFELFGDLVDGNRGLVEYNDFLKRPQDFNRYLLATSEKGTVSLDSAIVYLDAVLMGSANETYLSAFKGSPEYPSFNARLELVRMPYLLDYNVEKEIYDEQASSSELGVEVAPHTTYVAALWAVLTRLKRPSSDLHPEHVHKLVEHLSPLEKADLYAGEGGPDGLSSRQNKDLRRAVKTLMDEGAHGENYEGRMGVSPREMKAILLRCAQNQTHAHLSALNVFDELRGLVKEVSVYQFLQMEPDGDYRRHEHFIDLVTERYLDLVDLDVRSAMGLVSDANYVEYFGRYVEHITHWLQNEKVYNKTTGDYAAADDGLMEEVEAMVGAGDDADFRKNIMTSVAAWSIDNPGQPIDYKKIFPQHFLALNKAYFDQRKEQVWRIKQNLLAYIGQEAGSLNEEELAQVKLTFDNLEGRFGYSAESAREAVVFLLKQRYEE